MLKAGEDEIEAIREYFEWQASDLQVTFLQKVYSEAVMNTRHDIWDIHTNKDRWWVITSPANLYSQQQFPNMDLALTFHLGLILRMPRSAEQERDDLRLLPFGPVFDKLEDVGDAVAQAHGLAGYQAVGVRCREALLEFIGVAQDAAVWTETPPQRANFREWVEIICNALLAGNTSRERRGALKGALESAWTFSNWLTHSKSATWVDAEMAQTLTGHAVGMASSLVVRQLRGVPEACPSCNSPNLEPEVGETAQSAGALWERPRCIDCGWVGRAVAIVGEGGGRTVITREGAENDDHGIMTRPLRAIRKPGDPEVQPLEDIEAGPPELTEYFAYGSNMSTQRLRGRTPSARPIGIATLPGHSLRFHKVSKDGSGKCDAASSLDEGAAVIGVLFAFNPAERGALDRAEGAGKGYEARAVTVINADGRRRKVLTYIAAPEAINGSLKPYDWYKEHVVAGAREHGLPEDYVTRYIEAVDAIKDPDGDRARKQRGVADQSMG